MNSMFAAILVVSSVILTDMVLWCSGLIFCIEVDVGYRL